MSVSDTGQVCPQQVRSNLVLVIKLLFVLQWNHNPGLINRPAWQFRAVGHWGCTGLMSVTRINGDVYDFE